MQQKEKNTYFVLVKFGDVQDRNRILDAHRNLKDCFDRISGNEHKLVFTAPVHSGFIIKTHLPAYVVKDYILGSNWESVILLNLDEELKPISTSCLLSCDSLLIMKIEDKFVSQGFTRELAWLQHH